MSTSKETTDRAASTKLYTKLEAVTQARHGKFGARRDGDYSFVSRALSVPSTLSELVLAQRHYPVVFAGDETPIPIILLGIREVDGNLFVNEAGDWEQHAYIPAFIRRYPFIAVPKPDGESLVLAVDVASDFVAEGVGEPFFDGDQPTEAASKAFDFSVRLHHDYQAAREFGAALDEVGILKAQQAEVALPEGLPPLKLTNFKMVDEEKLGALPDEVILEWRRRGWLPPLHAHLMSFANWTDIARRSHERRGLI